MTNSTPTNPPPALLTLAMIRQHYLPLAPRTLFRMISSGKFPKAEVVIGGKIRLWKRETVTSWVATNSRNN
jgi:predicted DNA-binding transcriptional regulator AlpA